MGGNRRNRSGNSSSNQHQNRNSESASSKRSSIRSTTFSRDLYQQNDAVLIEIEKGLNISWKDIGFCGLILIGMVAYGAVVGIAASMTISVYYFEKSISTGSSLKTSPLSQDFELMTISSSSSSTRFDATILSVNKLPSGVADPIYRNVATELHSSPFRTFNALMLVEESIPLGIEASSADHSSKPRCSENISLENCIADRQENDGSSPKLSTAQANRLVPNYETWLRLQPKLQISEPMIHPKRCQDGSSGFDDWNILREAVHEANIITEQRSARWSSYFANEGKGLSVFEDYLLYYEEDTLFRICPGVTLNARRGQINMNSANLVLECNDCTVDVGGTHLAFGPRARNVLVRGITFRGATSSSVTFFHDGADAIFEDCTWIGNIGVANNFGAIADLNSTSAVNFYRCTISQIRRRGIFGPTSIAGASSLSIRT